MGDEDVPRESSADWMDRGIKWWNSISDDCSLCGQYASHKVGEEDTEMDTHNLTNYLCCTHFKAAIGNCGHASAPPAPDAALAVLAELVELHDRDLTFHGDMDTAWARARALVAGRGEGTT